MLTESCVMFFSPSRAVLSAILRDEYLTSAVRVVCLCLDMMLFWNVFQNCLGGRDPGMCFQNGTDRTE